MHDRLRRVIHGEVALDAFSRGRYATDASVYQMMPVGVVSPKDLDDVHHCIELSREFNVPLLPRGGGTSQCGQTVNTALVLDNSRHLNRLLELDVANRRCVVEPGMVLDELNRQLKPHGLWFPVDVSTASRATIGGMTANNSCGQRSIYYGTMRHNVHAIDAILPDSRELRFDAQSTEAAVNAPEQLWKQLLALGEREASEVRARFPEVLRRVGGYNLDALIDESGAVNFAHLLVGSEGTLAYSRSIELKLSPLPGQKVVGICHFPTFYQAMDAAQHLVTLEPRGVELVDATMIGLARDIPLYRSTVEQFVRGDPAAVLLVEFAFEEQSTNLQHLQLLHEKMHDLGFSWSGEKDHWGGVIDAIDPGLQNAVNEVRKAGLNIMMSMKTEGKPVSFVEDCAVALPDLAEYTAALTEIFHKHNTTGTWYAHASVGCLHVRPVLNLKLEQDAATMRTIAEEATDLVLKYKGSHSGEHGDGISRSEFHTKMFGQRLVNAFAEVKQLFDPANLFNPGKIVNAPRMNDRTLFRYPPEYKVENFVNRLDWHDWPGAGGGFQGAVEMCNNNGACRKLQGGVMCPSYRVTRDERDVTRGRANSLRLALSGQLGDNALASADMAATMKLCVSCKGCKRECPTGVDMARMKIEVQAAQAAVHGYSLQDRLIAYLPRYARQASSLRALLNLRNHVPLIARLLEKVTGLSAERQLPQWRGDWFRLPARGFFKEAGQTSTASGEKREVVMLADTFNTWFEPENLSAAVNVLTAAGYRVHIAQAPRGQPRLCCGRTWLAAGMVEKARAEATRTLAALKPFVERGIPVIGLEPSCLLTLRDEYLALCPGPETESLAAQSWLLEEFIAAEIEQDSFGLVFESMERQALLHGHCHQKAFAAMSAVEKTLAAVPGLDVKTIDSSCCGMAGSFGYAAETAEVSIKMAELDLLPAVRAAESQTVIVADGTSCRHQIQDGAGRSALHVARVLEMALPPQA
ncbi:MAG: FAD-binding protein [Gammaproteobacteria bacterium]|nr:FAD-binding protein [Gammaproteobacteria bacterium]